MWLYACFPAEYGTAFLRNKPVLYRLFDYMFSRGGNPVKKISISMAKGGVGKTSTAVNLSAALAKSGKRILLVDCDPQQGTEVVSGVVTDFPAKPCAALVFREQDSFHL